MAGWKSTFSNGKYIFKWWIFHCYVSLPECNSDINRIQSLSDDKIHNTCFLSILTMLRLISVLSMHFLILTMLRLISVLSIHLLILTMLGLNSRCDFFFRRPKVGISLNKKKHSPNLDQRFKKIFMGPSEVSGTNILKPWGEKIRLYTVTKNS